MATSKAVKQPATTTNERTSQVQMNLEYAKRVEIAVKERRRKELQRRLDELDSLPVVHAVDVALRDDLIREVRAQMKALEGEKCPF
jgi:hypothetical protein